MRALRAGVILAAVLTTGTALGQLPPPAPRPSNATSETPPASPLSALQQPAPKLNIKYGKFPIAGDLATVNTGDKFGFLTTADAKALLVDLWGNPPQAMANVLGVIVPKNFDPVASWAVVITYDKIGHVDDDDAGALNADDLLKTLQEQQTASNEARQKQGYPAITLVGWARPPSYDAGQKKAVWAEHLSFVGQPVDTLNYNIRVLGREGVLVLNAIATMDQLPEIEAAEQGILGTSSFNPGQTYGDYDSGRDTAATVGIAGLIAGGAAVAAKVGLFKGLLIALAAGWKFIAIGAVAVFAFLGRLFKGKGAKTTPTTPT